MLFRSAAFDDACDEVEHDWRRVGDAVLRGHDREAAVVLLGDPRFVADGERYLLPRLNDELVVFEVELCGALDAAVVLDLFLAGVGDFDILGADLAEDRVELDLSLRVILRYFEEELEHQHEDLAVGRVSKQVHVC